MVARYAGASFGLLAFTITVLAGLYARNPVEVTLSRSLWALLLFFVVGLFLGGVAHRVIAEHEEQQKADIHKRYGADTAGTEDGDPKDGARPGTGEDVGATAGARQREE